MKLISSTVNIITLRFHSFTILKYYFKNHETIKRNASDIVTTNTLILNNYKN